MRIHERSGAEVDFDACNPRDKKTQGICLNIIGTGADLARRGHISYIQHVLEYTECVRSATAIRVKYDIVVGEGYSGSGRSPGLFGQMREEIGRASCGDGCD